MVVAMIALVIGTLAAVLFAWLHGIRIWIAFTTGAFPDDGTWNGAPPERSKKPALFILAVSGSVAILFVVGWITATLLAPAWQLAWLTR